MGRDKAHLEIFGRPLVAHAVAKLDSFCERVSIAGNRSDLGQYAGVVEEARPDVGPAAGIEAGLRSSACPWAMFLPVDVPLVPPALLRLWAEEAIARSDHGVRLSFLRTHGDPQPAFCLLHTTCLAPLTCALDEGERRLERVFARVTQQLGPSSFWPAEAEQLPFSEARQISELTGWFSNLNTPEDVSALERAFPASPAATLGAGKAST